MADLQLSEKIIGTWRLTSREDRSVDGHIIEENSLGPDPYGLLYYDRGGNFAAQFMKRDRSGDSGAENNSTVSGSNNTQAIGGYDAYFGTYTVDNERGAVIQRLVASLSPQNIGQTVTRELTVDGDTLTVTLATQSGTGEPVQRTLKWMRAG